MKQLFPGDKCKWPLQPREGETEQHFGSGTVLEARADGTYLVAVEVESAHEPKPVVLVDGTVTEVSKVG